MRPASAVRRAQNRRQQALRGYAPASQECWSPIPLSCRCRYLSVSSWSFQCRHWMPSARPESYTHRIGPRTCLAADCHKIPAIPRRTRTAACRVHKNRGKSMAIQLETVRDERRTSVVSQKGWGVGRWGAIEPRRTSETRSRQQCRSSLGAVVATATRRWRCRHICNDTVSEGPASCRKPSRECWSCTYSRRGA